jgi:hypothetical protein
MMSAIAVKSVPFPLARSIVLATLLWEAAVLATAACLPIASPLLVLSLLSLPFLPLAFFKGKLFFVLFLFVIVIVPAEAYQRVPIPVGLNNRIMWAGIAVVVVYWLMSLSLGKVRLLLGDLDMLVLIFVILIAVSAFTGVLSGHKFPFISNELANFFYLGIYFFVRGCLKKKSWLKVFIWLMVSAGAVVSLEYQSILLKGGTELGLGLRVQATQEIIYLIAFALLLSVILLTQSRRIRLLCLAVVPLVVAGAVISQTRGIWIGFVVILLSEFGVSLVVSKDRSKLFQRTLGVLLVIMGTLALGLSVVVKMVGPLVFFSMVSRFLSIGHAGGTQAVMWRVAMNKAVVDQIALHPFVGGGAGSSVTYSFLGGHFVTNWVDNSYLLLLWKFGIVGLVVYLGIIYLVFKKALVLLRSASGIHERVLGLGVIGLYAALVIWAVASAVFLKYRFNLIWATLMALVQTSYESCRTGHTELR